MPPRQMLAWAKAYEATARAYTIALTQAAGGLVLRRPDFVLTMFPYDHYVNGVISPCFSSQEAAAERVDEILQMIRERRQMARFKLGPSTQPAELSEILTYTPAILRVA